MVRTLKLIDLTPDHVGEVWSLPSPYIPIPIIPDRAWDPSCFIIGRGPNNTTLGVQLRPGSSYVYLNTSRDHYEALHHFNSFVSTRIFNIAQARATLAQPPQFGALERTFIALTESHVGELWSVPAPYTPVPMIADRSWDPSCFIIGYGPNNTTLGVQLRPNSSYVYANTGRGKFEELRQFNSFVSTRILTVGQYNSVVNASGRRLVTLTTDQVGEVWSVPAPYRPIPIIPDRAWDPLCFIIGFNPDNNTTLGVQLRPDDSYVYANTSRGKYDTLSEFNDFISTRLLTSGQCNAIFTAL